MTPAEIRLIKENITQENVDDLVDYLYNWLFLQRQPDKGLLTQLIQMKKDNIPPHEQVKQILGSLYDWFACGN